MIFNNKIRKAIANGIAQPIVIKYKFIVCEIFSYHKRFAKNNPTPFKSGKDSVQLFQNGKAAFERLACRRAEGKTRS
jgi:hypothetical protein